MSLSLTRRRLFGFASGVALAPTALSAAPALAGAVDRKPPVIGLHQDRPYIDFSGEAERFTASDGSHAGAAVAQLDAETFLRLNPFG